jgi:phenylalanyl-tRNA synthetase beta chain
VVELLLRGLGVGWDLEPGAPRPFHPGRSGVVRVDARAVGILGELHPAVASERDLPGRVALAELDVSALELARTTLASFRDVPRFPPVRRDLAFVVPEEVPVGAVQAAVEEAADDVLDRTLLFDVFRGDPLPPGRKSLAFSLEFRAPDRTLRDQEVEPAIAAIVERVRSAFGGELRA